MPNPHNAHVVSTDVQLSTGGGEIVTAIVSAPSGETVLSATAAELVGPSGDTICDTVVPIWHAVPIITGGALTGFSFVGAGAQPGNRFRFSIVAAKLGNPTTRKT